jgi:hypothetical protein
VRQNLPRLSPSRFWRSCSADFKDKLTLDAVEKHLATERRADGVVDWLPERDSVTAHSHRAIQDPDVYDGAAHPRALRDPSEPVPANSMSDSAPLEQYIHNPIQYIA